MKLAGQVAVVTGAGSGIGAAIAREFALEGAAVALLDVKLDAVQAVVSEIAKDGGRASGWAVDVTRQSEVEAAADAAETTLGPLSIWVNCAGVSKIVPFLECTEATWDLTLDVNLKGAFFCCQAAVRRMLPRGRGAIINLSSQSGKLGNSAYAAYCASKFGVIGLTQSLAQEFAAQGIRINAICPGIVPTPMWEQQTVDYARKRGMKPEEVRPYLLSKIPLGRVCEPREVARTAVFLASDGASYMTGQAINLTGGALMG